MNRRKRIVIISVIVVSLILCLMASILVNRDIKPLPLAVTFRNENGRSIAKYEVSLPSSPVRYFTGYGVCVLRSFLENTNTVLLKYSEGAWHPEVIGTRLGFNGSMLQYSIPTPTAMIWKLKVTTSGSYSWIRGNGMSITLPFKTRSPVFESQAFTNVFSAINQ